jgi:hypothetical protein
MAALGRFIVRSGENALPFFKLMKRTGKFEWTPKADKAFAKLKRYLTSPPIMVAPTFCEPLLIYIVATSKSFNTKLEAYGKKWLDNLQSIPWSIRTTATKPTGETPFFLVYGAEVVLPTDVKFGSPRVLAFNKIHQEDLIKDRLL